MNNYEIAYRWTNDMQWRILYKVLAEDFRDALEKWLEIMYFEYIDSIKEWWYSNYNSFKSNAETDFILTLLYKEWLWIYDHYSDDYDFSITMARIKTLV